MEVFKTGRSFLTGRAEDDREIRRGFREGLGVRSMACVSFDVGGERRGVLLASSASPEHFSESDLRFLEAASTWVGSVAHRAELVQQIAAQAAERGRQSAADEMVTTLAHDLRNYLAPIRARLQLMRGRAEREDQRRYQRDAELVLTSVDRLSRLVDDVLDVGRIEHGLFSLNLQPLDLVATVEDVARAMSTESVPVRVQVGDDEVVVSADPGRLRQCLENVLSNAVKHSPAGQSVTVQVQVRGTDTGQVAEVTVSDRGPGIPPEQVPHVFERFVAGPGSAGLGLGLYLAREIARAHDGSLDAESVPGHGARFTLRLPASG